MSYIDFWKRCFCFAWAPLSIGGSSKSQANTDTRTTNTNHVNTQDRRVVASDAAVAVSGNHNVSSRTESTTFTDSSNRSTSFSDSSNRSTSVTTTDFGSVSKSLDGISTMGKAAVDLGDSTVTGAISALKEMAQANLQATMASFDLARDTQTNSSRDMGSVLNFAAKNNEALSTSVNGPDQNKTVMIAALAVVGAIGAAIAFKKG